MTTVVFSDLDGTILFSKNAIPENLSIRQCTPVETYPNGQHGYMEVSLLKYLSQWTSFHTFIPVTTRSMKQYERLLPSIENWRVPFALVSNGGNLYLNGKIDNAWNAELREELKLVMAQKSKILAIINAKIPKEKVRKITEIDEWYYCILVKENDFNDKSVKQLKKELGKYKWVVYCQHKKWYVLPEQLSKERAVEKLKQKFLKSAEFKALGDTSMDAQMLKDQPTYLYLGKTSEGLDIKKSIYSCQCIVDFLEK